MAAVSTPHFVLDRERPLQKATFALDHQPTVIGDDIPWRSNLILSVRGKRRNTLGPGHLTVTEVFAMPIGRLHHLIINSPDPTTEARFWSAVLGDPITYADEDFVVVSANTATSGLAFQSATELTPPTWPEPTVPQQMHLDVMVDDQVTAGEAVLALGARRLPGTGFAGP
ncbi:VOC family protein [Micromonospora avicenniae]|uniref:VOC family protein n=1 Tax=Micromonospora avicenniae TaxID=1198245 RepID=UPI0033184C70